MKAADVMVSAVISVRPNARVEEVARILLASRISAVPVIDEQGELLGIVSEGDLMRRAEAGTERRRSWWLEHLTGKQVLAAEYVKSHSHKVSDVPRCVCRTARKSYRSATAMPSVHGSARVRRTIDRIAASLSGCLTAATRNFCQAPSDRLLTQINFSPRYSS